MKQKTYARRDSLRVAHIPAATIKNGVPFSFRLRDYTACENDPDVGVQITYNNTNKVFVLKIMNFTSGSVFKERDIDTSKYNSDELINVFRFERKKVLAGHYDNI